MNRHNAGPLNPLLRVAGLGFHQPSAEDAWGRILRFFDAHLRDRPSGITPARKRSICAAVNGALDSSSRSWKARNRWTM